MQSTGADILKRVVVNLGIEARRRNLDAYLLLTAHDELLGPKHDYTVLTLVPPVPDYAARFVTE